MRTVDGSVLVTGAGGFIGSHLVDALLAGGHRVTGLDRRTPASDPLVARNLREALRSPAFRLVHGDLSKGGWQHAVQGHRVVFHLAAVPGVRESWSRRFDDYAASNVLGTQRLLAACVEAGVARLVYASSSSVYGNRAGPSREFDPPAPQSPYGVSKLAGEQLCAAYTAQPGVELSTIALRYFTVYGPRQRPDMAIGRMLSAALTATTFRLFGNGSQVREFTEVSDVVAATVAAGRARAAGSVALNVGGGASHSVREVLDIAGQVVGRSVRVVEEPARAGDVPETAADLTAASALLDYRPRVDLTTGMAHQARWLLDQTGSLAEAPATGGVEHR